MGIQLKGNSNFNPVLYQIQSNSTALSESDFINALSNLTSRIFTGSSGNYSTIAWYSLDESSNYQQYLPTTSPVSNFYSPIRGSVTITHDEDEDYEFTYYSVPLTFTHIKKETIVTTNSFRELYDRIIYWRKANTDICCGEQEVIPYDDGYRGSENIVVTFKFVQIIEKSHEEPVPIVPTSYGAFPNGLGADYCYLLCRTDLSYATSLDLADLNKMANDYAQTINPSLPTYDYYGEDSGGKYVVVDKETVDNSPELQSDWQYLYGSTINLQNSVIQCEINGQIKDCYKIYLAGKCQLIEFDGQKFVEDQGGTTDVPEYNLPNGYYIIVGDQLRLFLLTDIDSAIYPYNGSTSLARFSDNSTVGNGTVSLTPRTNYDEVKWYVYSGHETPNISEVTAENVIFSEISNLRKVAMSDTIINVGHLGGQANPDNGFYFPKHIQSIGPLTITYTAQTSVYIPSGELINISDNAFYNGVSVNVNMRLFLCENPETAEQTYPTGYFKPGPTLQSIGKLALYGLKLNVIDLTEATNLTQIGQQALAVDTATKNFYFLASQISDRTGVTNQNLVHVPDEVLLIVNENVPYDSSAFNSCTYTDQFYRTLGEYLTGYRIYLR